MLYLPYKTNQGEKPASSEVGLDINVNSSHRFAVHFTPPDFFLQVLPSDLKQLWELLHLTSQKKEEWISGPAGCKEVFGNLAYNRMKLSDFWQGYNPCPSPSLPWEQLLHTPVTLPFLRNVLVPFHVPLVHLQNKLKSHPAHYLCFLGCWPGKGGHTVDGPELSACWLTTEKHKLIG